MSKPIKPINPSEVVALKRSRIPDEVIEAFNEAIVDRYDNGIAKVDAEDIAREIAARISVSTDEVYRRKLLDVEDIYRAEGWTVQFHTVSGGRNFFMFRHGPANSTPPSRRSVETNKSDESDVPQNI